MVSDAFLAAKPELVGLINVAVAWVILETAALCYVDAGLSDLFLSVEKKKRENEKPQK